MTEDPRRQVLRLRKKHAPADYERPTPADGARLVQAQSIWHAIGAGLVVIVVFAAIWSMLTQALGRYLPWLSLLLGVLVGLAVRRGGQGLDWRFPALAAVLTLLGALLGLIVVSAGTTAEEFDTSVFTILRNVTTMTWPVFFDEVVGAADIIYALFGALIASALAPRRLDRRQFHAVRLWQESSGDSSGP